MEDTIKVHVTEKQRDCLEFLVNRRINDILFQRQQTADHLYKVVCERTETELSLLRSLKTELQHAGT